MRTGLLWNENLFAGADRCACSICTGTHSSDKKLNASVLPGWDRWSSLQQRVMLFCVSLMPCPSAAVFDLKAQAVLQNSFLSQKPPQLLIPGIASDVLGDRAPGLGLVFPHSLHLPGWSRAGSRAVVALHSHAGGFIHEP